MTAVKRSRRREAEAGEARRGPAAQRTTRTALDSLGSERLGLSRIPQRGRWGQGGAIVVKGELASVDDILAAAEP